MRQVTSCLPRNIKHSLEISGIAPKCQALPDIVGGPSTFFCLFRRFGPRALYLGPGRHYSPITPLLFPGMAGYYSPVWLALLSSGVASPINAVLGHAYYPHSLSIPWHSIPLHSTPLHSITSFHSMPDGPLQH